MPGEFRGGANAAGSRRVLFLAAQLGPGGVTAYMRDVGAGLRSFGWEVAVASRGRVGEHSHGPEWLGAAGIKHFRVPFPHLRLTPVALVGAMSAAAALRRAVLHFRPHIVHVHWRSVSVFARGLEAAWGTPFVSSMHVDRIPAGRVQRMMSFWGKAAVAVSRETRDHLVHDFGVPVEDVRTVYYGRDEDYFRPPLPEERRAARKAMGMTGDVPVVALVGSGVRRKGHAVLLDAVAALGREGVSALAVFAGDSSEAETIREMARARGVADRVLSLGYVESRTVLWAADIFCLPSLREGLPVAVIEAMLCGVVPVRTPAAGAADQIVDGENGYVVPFGDATVLACRLRELIRDPERRRTMGEAALRHARTHFTLRRMVAETAAIYEEVLRERKESEREGSR